MYRYLINTSYHLTLSLMYRYHIINTRQHYNLTLTYRYHIRNHLKLWLTYRYHIYIYKRHNLTLPVIYRYHNTFSRYRVNKSNQINVIITNDITQIYHNTEFYICRTDISHRYTTNPWETDIKYLVILIT